MNKMETIEQLLSQMRTEKTKKNYINPSDIPNIDLYMDQITTFMDSQLADCKRYEDDKILTKTMINNYAKNNLLPPPEKKKYSKDHLLLLTFIYYFKNILSMSDVQSLIEPITKTYFQKPEQQSMEHIYQEVFNLEYENLATVMDDISSKFKQSQTTFPDAADDEKDLLNSFSFLCSLMYDVYLKKQLVERIIDSMKPSDPDKDKKQKK